MKTRLAILLWSVSVDRPELAAAPFVYASAACAMDCEVEIHFAGSAVRLLEPGVADALFNPAEPDYPIGWFMRNAARAGARFYGCGMALHTHGLAGRELIPEYTGAAGAAAFVARTLDEEWATMIF